MSGLRIRVWDIASARTKASTGEQPVHLTRQDGSSSGLCVLPGGQLSHTVLKPQGKAARKEFKRLRRQLSGGNLSPVASRILQRRMRNLCGLGDSAPSALKVQRSALDVERSAPGGGR